MAASCSTRLTSSTTTLLRSIGGLIIRTKRIDENKSGVALAISIENPDLTGNERFGVAMNYGNFEGASALSWSAMGVLGYDVLSRGDRVAISGGFGVGFEEGAGDDVWGGRVGAQWTWGRKACPLRLEIVGPKNDDGRPEARLGPVIFIVSLPSVHDDELLHLRNSLRRSTALAGGSELARPRVVEMFPPEQYRLPTPATSA